MKETYKKPDLNAPRNRKPKNDFLSYPDKDTHGLFAKMKSEHPELAKYKNREIAKWIEMYNKALADQVVSDGWNGVKLPEDLGVVIVSACRVSDETKKRNIDFHTSNQYGKAIPYRNLHCDEKVARIIYYNDIPYHKFENGQLWTFEACRALQRAVSKDFKEGKQNHYKSFSKSRPISTLFHPPKITKERYKDSQKHQDDLLRNYNPLAWD